MKNRFYLLCLLFALQTAWAQDVIVTVQVLPPYSTYLPDYLNNPTKIVFTMLSTRDRDVKIRATITGDNGITIATSPTGSAATPIHLTANQVKMMNGTNLKAYLDANSVTVAGISKDELYRGNGIPEGNYTVCLQVLDYATNQPLSQPAPTGCSNPFNVMQINPPTLVAPTCDNEITGTQPQNLVFTWLPAPGAAPTTRYRLKIVELVPNNRNPNEAMNSATTPAFFETTTTAFSFFYGPAQPPLKDGKRYAWRVTALGPLAAGVPQKTDYQNNGASEVCSFVYKKPAILQNTPASYGINLIKPIKGEKIYSGYGLEFQWSASSKNINSYELQFTNSYKQDQPITNWALLPENLFSRPDAFMARKDVGKNLSEKLSGGWTSGKGKIAWRILAKDANDKPVDSSRIETYEVVDAPLADRIKLVSPIQGKQIVAGYGLKFEWQPSKKQTVNEYRLQFTNATAQGKEIVNWGSLPQDLFSKKSSYFVWKDTKQTTIDLPPSWTNGLTKMAWRVVGMSYGQIVDSSAIETYEIIEDKSDLAKMKSFQINGYWVVIKSLGNKDQDHFSGSGTVLLWEGGKQVDVEFKELKVRPFAVIAKTQQKQWVAIDGSMDIEVAKRLYKANKFMLDPTGGMDGSIQVALNTMKVTAKVEGAMDEATQLFKPTADLGHTEAKVVGKWLTNFFKPKAQQTPETNLYEVESNESEVKMSFADKFDGNFLLKPQTFYEMGNGSGNITVVCGANDMKMTLKGLTGTLDLAGEIKVPNAKPLNAKGDQFVELSLPFQNQKNFNFPHKIAQPLVWAMSKDGSVMANVSDLYVHLSPTGTFDAKYKNYPYGLNFDQFGVTIQLPEKQGQQGPSSMKLSFGGLYNMGKGYTNNKLGEQELKYDVKVAGFTAQYDQCLFLVNKNKLLWLYMKGRIYVPFLNDWAAAAINIDDEKIQEMGITFNYDKKYYLSKADGEAYINLASGRLEDGAIIISPILHVWSNGNKGVETKTLYMCDTYIDPNGTLSFNLSFKPNTESTCQVNKQAAKYFNFDFNVDQIKIKRNAVKTDATLLFSGDLVLAPGIATTSRKEAGFVYHGKAPTPGSGYFLNDAPNPGWQNNVPNNVPPKAPTKIPKNFGGPDAGEPSMDADAVATEEETSIEWSDDKKAVQGGYEDGGQKFGGGFSLVTDDATWGNCFKLGGYYETKEPSAKQLEATMILGKKKKMSGAYSYWFFSFAQKGFVTVPVILGIAEIYGFGGKTWYHMAVSYNNMGEVTNMVPDPYNSLGIAASADFRTQYDQGITLKGKAVIKMQFEGWSLDGIDYFVNGSALAASPDSEGMLKARINGSLNWTDKYLDGHGQIWGGIKKIVCINDGAAGEDSINFHFGADDFYINVGSQESPITADVLCGSGLSAGVWLSFGKSDLGFGYAKDYDSGWHGLNLGVASAKGRLTSSMSLSANIHYWPFQASGSGSFSGRAYGKGCVKWVGCIGGSCGVSANLNVTMPDPTVIEGAVRCDVSRWIPDFTLHAKWSSESGFSIYL